MAASEHPALPEGSSHVRTTPTFDTESVPAGLLSRHRLGGGTWGRLVVESGAVQLVFEDDAATGRWLAAGEHGIIPPGRPHHVVLGDGARFAVEFHRT